MAIPRLISPQFSIAGFRGKNKWKMTCGAGKQANDRKHRIRDRQFPIWKGGIFRPGKEIKGLRGGVHRYAAQETTKIDTARAEKDPFRIGNQLYGLPDCKAPYLEVPHLEVVDVDLVIEQNRGLKGAESQAVFCAYIFVVINEFATSTRAFDGFGRSGHD